MEGRKNVTFASSMVEEVYDPLYSSEGSVTDHTLPCDILQEICCIYMKEVRLHDIAQYSLSSEC